MSTIELNIRALSFLLLVSFSIAQDDIFDITKYGGHANQDIVQALSSAWQAACASPNPTKVVIPRGVYKLNQAILSGPCKSPIELQVHGKVQGPATHRQLKMSKKNWINVEHVNFFKLSGTGTFDGLGPKSWGQNKCAKDPNCKMLPMNFSFNFLNNSIIQGVTSKDSKNFHVNVLGCQNITFDQFTVIAPAKSPNTDGIHIGRSNGVTISNSKIGTGDDCVSIGDGSKQVHITGITCGPGHGISVGSLGRYKIEQPVEGIYVKNCTLQNTENGVRIKTWPNSPLSSFARDMHFEDITLKNVSNPILIDQEYCPWNHCNKKVPSTIKLSKMSFKNIKGTSETEVAVKLACSSSVPCDAVELADIDITYNGGAAKSICSNVEPKFSGEMNPPACQGA